MNNVEKTVLRATTFGFFLGSIKSALSLTCYCEGHCPGNIQNGTCETRPGGYCFSTIEELWDADVEDLVDELSFGCLAPGDEGFLQCEGYLVPHLRRKTIKCCTDSHFCNQKNPAQLDFTSNIHHKNDYTIVTIPLASLLTILVAFTFATVLMYNRCRNSKPRVKLASSRDSLRDLIDQSSGSGSGVPLLIQRTISQQLVLSDRVGQGRYGEVWLARWREERVAVKVFFTLEEASWFRETEIYQTTMIRHDNILSFIAADIKGSGGWTQMLLITDYHEKGSLYDYLQTRMLDRHSLLAICTSIASGMAHLHTEIFGSKAKPAIAHRDIKSKNVLVKQNGECVIADFGLAVRYISETNKIDIALNARVGTRRYMAPEVLDESINLHSFDALKTADMYSVGLVLWEVCRRCATGGKLSIAEPYALPYYDIVASDPDFEEMRLAVCVNLHRPIIPIRWENDAVLSVISKLLTECWHSNPAVRLTALRVKKTLSKLQVTNSIKIV